MTTWTKAKCISCKSPDLDILTVKDHESITFRCKACKTAFMRHYQDTNGAEVTVKSKTSPKPKAKAKPKKKPAKKKPGKQGPPKKPGTIRKRSTRAKAVEAGKKTLEASGGLFPTVGEVEWPAGLSDKQKAFCLEYLIDHNQIRAALRAGYEEASAHVSAYNNMSNLAIRGVIHKLIAQDVERIQYTREQLISGLIEVIESSPADFKQMGADGITTEDIGPEHPLKRIIKKMRSIKRYSAEGELTGVTNEIETDDRMTARKLLAEMMGFTKDESKLGGDIIIQTVVEGPKQLEEEENT